MFAGDVSPASLQRALVPITRPVLAWLGVSLTLGQHSHPWADKTAKAQNTHSSVFATATRLHGQHLTSVLSDVSCPWAPGGSSSVLRLVSLSHYWPPRPRLSLPWPHPLPSPASASRPQLTSSPHLSSSHNHSRAVIINSLASKLDLEETELFLLLGSGYNFLATVKSRVLQST